MEPHYSADARCAIGSCDSEVRRAESGAGKGLIDFWYVGPSLCSRWDPDLRQSAVPDLCICGDQVTMFSLVEQLGYILPVVFCLP